MNAIEFVDRYSATGTPYPCPWTTCKGRCQGMGVYPTKRGLDGIEPKEAPESDEDMGYWFVTCEQCYGTGSRITGKKAYYLHLLYTYWYQLQFPFWAARRHEERSSIRGLIRHFFLYARFIHREQRQQRRLLKRGV